ncbi:MAG TPA: tryptophan synthase subunit alpha [Gemmataceae bacterium]|jgi:tryptophan synthase alpha chain|nr:tryptophan synthase subunit alpha [Gemmataceae bacterium]
MNAIDVCFRDLRNRRQKAFMPFLTAGDPDLDTSSKLIEEAARRGASLIEIGFPYSDPIADGSVIQASYNRALGKRVKLDAIFRMIHCVASSEPFHSGKVPLVAMVSYSLVHHRGPERFIADARTAGLSGAIVPDLPVEESVNLAKLAASRDFKLIQLVTPTTPKERARQIARNSSGFLYCVSVVGITGSRAELPPILMDQLTWLRTVTELPLCVGFGISKPEHVVKLRDAVDGVIVGSHLVGRLAKGTPAEMIRDVGAQVELLSGALRDR